jgi:hypothetical protein
MSDTSVATASDLVGVVAHLTVDIEVQTLGAFQRCGYVAEANVVGVATFTNIFDKVVVGHVQAWIFQGLGGQYGRNGFMKAG